MSKTVAEVNQSRHFDLVSMAQIVCRNRHGDNPTEKQVTKSVQDIVDMMNKEVYTVTVLEMLQVQAELYRRYQL